MALPQRRSLTGTGLTKPLSVKTFNVQRRLVRVAGFGSAFKKFVTGSAASVELVTDDAQLGVGPPCLGAPFDVLIKVKAASELDINKVYLKVRNFEMLDQYPVDTIDFEKTVTDTTVVFDTEMDVAGERTIAEGQSLEWKAQVILPESLQPSFNGKYIRNVWEMEAGLGTGVMGGRNPSSGWVELDVRRR